MGDDKFSNWLKALMNFIDRVGFPIFSFVVISVICWYTLTNFSALIMRNTEVTSSLKEVILTMDSNTKYFQNDVKRDHKEMQYISNESLNKIDEVCQIVKDIEKKKIKN